MESTSRNHRSLVASTETQRAQALEHFHLIRPFLEGGVPLTHIAVEHRLSVRTLRRWVQQYRSHGLAGLIRATRKNKVSGLQYCNSWSGSRVMSPPLSP